MVRPDFIEGMRLAFLCLSDSLDQTSDTIKVSEVRSTLDRHLKGLERIRDKAAVRTQAMQELTPDWCGDRLIFIEKERKFEEDGFENLLAGWAEMAASLRPKGDFLKVQGWCHPSTVGTHGHPQE